MFEQRVSQIFSRARLPLAVESETQQAIAELLEQKDVPFVREFCLDSRNRIDFYLPDGTGIEIKLKGSAKRIYQQCERYCSFTAIEQFFLITNRSMGFPETINGKPCYVIKLGRTWL